MVCCQTRQYTVAISFIQLVLSKFCKLATRIVILSRLVRHRLSGDFNGDGVTDILRRDNASPVAMWLMNAGTIVSNLQVANVPTAWSIQGAGAD